MFVVSKLNVYSLFPLGKHGELQKIAQSQVMQMATGQSNVKIGKQQNDPSLKGKVY